MKAGEEEPPRGRIPYELADDKRVFFMVLSLHENWEKLETIEEIAALNESKLPLIFGKRAFFVKVGLWNVILGMLNFVLNHMEFDSPFDRWGLPKIDGIYLIPPMEVFRPEFEAMASTYPTSPRKNEALTDRITREVLGLPWIFESSPEYVPWWMHVILSLREDPDLREKVGIYLEEARTNNLVEEVKIKWWSRVWRDDEEDP